MSCLLIHHLAFKVFVWERLSQLAGCILGDGQQSRVCRCCSLNHKLQNRSEPKKLLHKSGLNAQVKIRGKQIKHGTLMHFAHNPSQAGGGMFLLSSESHVGCQILSLLMEARSSGKARAHRWQRASCKGRVWSHWSSLLASLLCLH